MILQYRTILYTLTDDVLFRRLSNTHVVGLRKFVPEVIRPGSNRKQSLRASPTASLLQLQQTKSKSHITRPTIRLCRSLSEVRPSLDHPTWSQDETLKRPWTTFQVSVFGPQSDIRTLLPTGKAGGRLSHPKSAVRFSTERCIVLEKALKAQNQ